MLYSHLLFVFHLSIHSVFILINISSVLFVGESFMLLQLYSCIYLTLHFRTQRMSVLYTEEVKSSKLICRYFLFPCTQSHLLLLIQVPFCFLPSSHMPVPSHSAQVSFVAVSPPILYMFLSEVPLQAKGHLSLAENSPSSLAYNAHTAPCKIPKE